MTTTPTLTKRAARAAVNAVVETITPKRAGDYLATMERNRPTKHAKIEQYARDMEAGRWHLNGEPLIFGSNGRLLDGWHRMKAILKAGLAVEMLVVRGVDPEGFMTIDTGASRDFGDVLTLEGETNAKMAAAATRLWLLYEQDAFSKKWVPTALERHEMFERHRAAIEAGVPLMWRFPQARKLLGAANVAFLLSYLVEKFDEETALLFLESVDKGDGLQETDPVYALRRVLVNNAMASRRARGEQLLAFAVKAFAYWQKGKRVKVLVVRSDEAFPRFPAPGK